MNLTKQNFQKMVSDLIDAGAYCISLDSPPGLCILDLTWFDINGNYKSCLVCKSSTNEGRSGQSIRYGRWLDESKLLKADLILPTVEMSATDMLELCKLVLTNVSRSCENIYKAPSQSDRAIIMKGTMKRLGDYEYTRETAKWLARILPLDGCYPISSFKESASIAIADINRLLAPSDLNKVREDKLAEARKLSQELSHLIGSLVDTYSDVSHYGSSHAKNTFLGLVERSNNLSKGIMKARL